MKIKPIGNRIQLKIDEPKVGNLNTDSLKTNIEVGEVIGIGNAWNLEQEPVKVGDKVQFKSWAVDIVTIDGKRYYYLNQDTKGLCALVTA